MTRNYKRLTCLIIAFMAVCLSPAKAQTVTEVLENLYRTYDSIPYLSFDVEYRYNSDTVNNDLVSDMLKGSYTIAGKKASFELDGTEYMQNDSIFISVNNREKYILISEPRNENAGRELPMRALIDSLVSTYGAQFIVTQGGHGDTGKIRYENLVSDLFSFKYFEMAYDINDFILYSVYYEFMDEAPQDEASADLQFAGARKNSLTVSFSNYRFDNISSEIYNQERFVFLEDGEYKPVDKYEGYRIFNSKKITGGN